MAPIGWGYAAFVWGYALASFLISDRVKLLAYRIFDPTHGTTPTVLTPPIATVSK